MKKRKKLRKKLFVTGCPKALNQKLKKKSIIRGFSVFTIKYVKQKGLSPLKQSNKTVQNLKPKSTWTTTGNLAILKEKEVYGINFKLT